VFSAEAPKGATDLFIGRMVAPHIKQKVLVAIDRPHQDSCRAPGSLALMARVDADHSRQVGGNLATAIAIEVLPAYAE
jgi:hypothetical protein